MIRKDDLRVPNHVKVVKVKRVFDNLYVIWSTLPMDVSSKNEREKHQFICLSIFVNLFLMKYIV